MAAFLKTGGSNAHLPQSRCFVNHYMEVR